MGVTAIVMVRPEMFIRIFNTDQELIDLFPALLPWKVLAVVLAEPAADLVTTGTNAVYFRRFIRKKLENK